MDHLVTLIAENASRLRCPETLNPVTILHALAEVESKHGAHGLATRHEQAYCYGGFYYRGPNGDDLRRLSTVWGCLVHCSYSSWQLLFMAAYELGFRGDPCELRNDKAAIHWVIKYLNRRILDRWPRISVEGLADAYNSGRPDDATRPVNYIAAFEEAYRKWAPC